MTDYERKSLKLLEKINGNLEAIMRASGVAVPEEPVRTAMRVSADALEQVARDRRLGTWKTL